MRNYLKTGLLIVVLVVPVLVFLFLQGYTTNHFDLPYYVPLRSPVTDEVIVENGDTTFYQIGDFSLSSIDSQSTVNSAQLRNKITVISTLSGSFDGKCEKILSNLNRIHALHETIPSVTLLTIITTQDTTLTKRIYDRSKEGWLVARVSEKTYNEELQNIFHLTALDKGQTISEYKPFSLVDRNGFIRGYYNAQEDEEIERLLAEIRVLEYNNKMKQK
jgi:protein SCO1